MNFRFQDLENKVNKKADDWKVNNLEQKISQLERENQNLKESVQSIESKFQNYYNAIDALRRAVLNQGLENDNSELYEIMNYL